MVVEGVNSDNMCDVGRRGVAFNDDKGCGRQ